MFIRDSGDTMVPITRLGTIGGVPIESLVPPKKLEKIVNRTRFAGGEIVKLFGNGSAFYAPAQSAIEMAESFLRDKKRVIPCASLCKGEFGIDGYFIGVPSLIGKGGVEKILEFDLSDSEKYFGIAKNKSSRYELGANLTFHSEGSLFENVNYRQDLKLFSNYLEDASNVDLDYLVQIDFDVNPLLSTQLIFQLIYDDNAVSRLQVREVFGIGAQLKLN